MSDYIHEDLFDSHSREKAIRAIVGKNVLRLRTEQELNKKTFANIANISRPLLDKIERGEADLRVSYIVRLADGLSVPPADLVTEHSNER